MSSSPLFPSQEAACRDASLPRLQKGTIILLEAIKGSSRARDLERGKAVHAAAIETGEASIRHVATSLINMYAKCGSMANARQVFEGIPRPCVVSWTALILGYAANGEGEEALRLFKQMVFERHHPNPVTFVAALKACISLAGQEEAQEVDGKMVKASSLEKGVALHEMAVGYRCLYNMKVASTLLSMYAKCSSMERARKVFDSMNDRDVVCWTALITGYAENGEGQKALDIFYQMKREGYAPDLVTFVAVLKACVDLAAKEIGKEVDGKLVKTLALEEIMLVHRAAAECRCDSDIKVASCLVDLYAKCGVMSDARRVFDGMYSRNVVSWTTVILAYALNGDGEEALQLLEEMKEEGCLPNSVTFVAVLKACIAVAEREEGKVIAGKIVKLSILEKGMIFHSQVVEHMLDQDIKVASTLMTMFSKCGCMGDACQVFDGMNHVDTVCWNALIFGYAENGEGKEALNVFHRMASEGWSRNYVTLVAALKACGMVGALEYGRALHVEIQRRALELDPRVATSLIDFYGKCWRMDDARRVFESLPEKGLVEWTAMLAGYSRHGQTAAVFDLFQKMQDHNVQPSGITFLCVLSACSHAALIDQGKEYFEAMLSKHKIVPFPEHYSCMVDMLARAGRLHEAVEMVDKMPFAPDAATWRAILGASRKWRDVNAGELSFRCLVNLEPTDAVPYLLMSDIYRSTCASLH